LPECEGSAIFDRLMDRRAFVGSPALGTLGASAIARAQPARKAYRIGILGSSLSTADMVGPNPRNPTLRAFLGGLRELGYVYGRDFVTEPRGGEGKLERFPALAAELVCAQADVILGGGPVLPALKQATSTIPVVMVGAADPVSQGLAQSVARPAGNFTGLSLQLVETTGSGSSCSRSSSLGAAPVAVFWDRHSAPAPCPGRRPNRPRASAGGHCCRSTFASFAGEIEALFKAATDARAAGLLVIPVALFDQNARRVAELAVKSRLPAMYALRAYVEAGGLMWYGADIVDLWRRGALFVDKILKGATAGDLPIEQPTKFELVINLKAARAIGLTIPQSLRSRADEIVQ
jgi:putative ABC transport system substrate-binding protein